jgi:hypothetical protein
MQINLIPIFVYAIRLAHAVRDSLSQIDKWLQLPPPFLTKVDHKATRPDAG